MKLHHTVFNYCAASALVQYVKSLPAVIVSMASALGAAVNNLAVLVFAVFILSTPVVQAQDAAAADTAVVADAVKSNALEAAMDASMSSPESDAPAKAAQADAAAKMDVSDDTDESSVKSVANQDNKESAEKQEDSLKSIDTKALESNIQSTFARIEKLKQDMIVLNADFDAMEEKQVAEQKSRMNLYVVINKSRYFSPDVLKIIVDDQLVDQHVYNSDEIMALRRGAVQHIKVDNLTEDSREITIMLDGFDGEGRLYNRRAILEVDGGVTDDHYRVVIDDRELAPKTKRDIELTIKPWKL